MNLHVYQNLNHCFIETNRLKMPKKTVLSNMSQKFVLQACDFSLSFCANFRRQNSNLLSGFKDFKRW